VEVRTGAIVKIPEFYSMGGARSQNSHFFRVFIGYPSGVLRTAYRKQFYPKSMVLMESGDSEGVLLALVWRVCDQAFGRYRPLKGAEKWSCEN